MGRRVSWPVANVLPLRVFITGAALFSLRSFSHSRVTNYRERKWPEIKCVLNVPLLRVIKPGFKDDTPPKKLILFRIHFLYNLHRIGIPN